MTMPGQQPTHEYDLSNFYHGAGEDIYDLLKPFDDWWNASALPAGYHLYQEAMLTPAETEVTIRGNQDGQTHDLINFSSYNYLGLAASEVAKEAVIEAVRKYGLGASGGPILSGVFDIHRELETELARFKNKEAAILYSSGYSANVGIISALMRSGDHLFLDQYSHASILDGAILSKAHTTLFRHNNPADLDRKLTGVTGKKLVVVEGIYSMDGDFCPLPEIVAVAKKHNARIMIDEAHSSFLCGPHGRGAVELFGLESEVDFHMGTFSKALGGIGGYACGSREFIQYLTAYSRSRFFSCTLPPAITAGILANLRYAEENPLLRRRLGANADYMRERLKEEGVDIGASASQIIPVMIYDDKKAFRVAEKIRARGIYLQPATYPGVPKRKARLRVSVSAGHTCAQLNRAIDAIVETLREEGVIA
jgi:8-amino-7-oxononanoate synthase